MKTQIEYKAWLWEWLKSREGFVKESTYANYSIAIINHIIPSLGDCRLDELTEEKIQETVLWWLSKGRLDHKGGLSEKTVRDMLMIVKLSLRAAAKKRLISPEEIDILFPKTMEITKLKVLSKEDYQKISNSVCHNLNSRSVGILLCLQTGIRIGELCALQWRDIDLREQMLSITKTIQRVFLKEIDGQSTTKVIISTPKTQASVREIPLSNFMIPVLKKIIVDDPNAYVVTGTEKYLEPRTYRSFYEHFLTQNQISHINFHGLRHTFATRCIEGGADYKTVSELLGHASVNMTLNLYVHPQIEQKRKCIELAQSVL